MVANTTTCSWWDWGVFTPIPCKIFCGVSSEVARLLLTRLGYTIFDAGHSDGRSAKESGRSVSVTCEFAAATMMLMALSWWLGFHVRVEATAVANIAAAIQRHVKTFFSKF